MSSPIRGRAREAAESIMRRTDRRARFEAYAEFMAGGMPLADSATVARLDYRARTVSAIREVCERRRLTPPWVDGP